MSLFKTLMVSVPIALIALVHAPNAAACGGTFVEVNAQQTLGVSGHQMVLSLSTSQTTLWDQIVYQGKPESFAWVLPTKGEVEVGLSSDELFQALAERTSVTIIATGYCEETGGCEGTGGSGTGTGGGLSLEGEDSPVDVIAHAVVGPYETVQITSQDPAALQTWLASHGFAIPEETAPLLDAYVAEGFGFLAVKLVPGKSVTAMRPLRVTTPGASPALPLRMVAAGAGSIVPITLWVVSEGRYGPSNFPSFQVSESDLFWSWSAMKSNYEEIVKSGFAAGDGTGWLVEAAEPLSQDVGGDLLSRAEKEPAKSGYAGDPGKTPLEACQADLEDLFAGIDPPSMWVTKLRAALPRAALDQDLILGATSQYEVSRTFQVYQSSDEPICPPPEGCGETSGSGAGGDGSGGGSPTAEGGCAVQPPADSLPPSVAAVAIALAVTRRRRFRRR